MKYFFKVLNFIFIFLLLITFYNLMLYLASLFPSSMIYENCVKSAKQMKNEGYAYLVLFPYTIDNATDALIINEAYSIDSTEPVDSYLKIRKNFNKDVVKYQLSDTTHDLLSYSQNNTDENGKPISDNGYFIIDELIGTLNKNLTTSVNYARYYHGYLAFYRPLLLLFDAFGIRVLSLTLFLIAFIVLAYELYKKLGKFNMFAICFSLIAFDFFATSYSLQQAPIMLLSIIASIIVLKKIDKLDWNKLFYFTFAVGSITCFLDYLTTPTLTLALPLLIYVIYCSREQHYSNKDLFVKTFLACVSWAIGYAFTWISKWVIADTFTDANVIKSALEQIKYRSIGLPRTEVEYIQVLIKHLCFSFAFCVIMVLILDTLLQKKIILFGNNKPYNENKIVVLFVCIVPILWCFVAFNHFINHSMLSYKNFMLILAYVLLIFFEKSVNRKHQ